MLWEQVKSLMDFVAVDPGAVRYQPEPVTGPVRQIVRYRAREGISLVPLKRVKEQGVGNTSFFYPIIEG